MKILIIETFYNGTGLAQRLCHESPRVEGVWLATDRKQVTGIWGDKFRGIVSLSDGVPALVDFVKCNGIDLVVNGSAAFGELGVFEAMETAGVPCIGSNFRLSATEIRKQDFKDWLVANGFKTPQTLFRGYFADVLAKASEFSYPLVIKPHRQSGAKVHVCQDREALLKYLEWTRTTVPHWRLGVVFSIEQHIEIHSYLGGVILLCGGKALLAAALRYHVTPPPRPDKESRIVTTRHPGYQPWKAELKRYSELIKDFAKSAQTFAQCVLTPSGEMYFLESNARPGGHTALFSSFADPLDGLLCMERQDHAMLAQHLQDIDVGVELGIVLQHSAKAIPIDFALLNSLPGSRFVPLSVLPDNGGYVSHRMPIPSSLVMEAATPEEAFRRLQEVAPLIQRAGDFLPINLERVRAELFAVSAQ